MSKEVIYSGIKHYETLYGDRSMRNSWRNHWLWPKWKNCHCPIPRGQPGHCTTRSFQKHV